MSPSWNPSTKTAFPPKLVALFSEGLQTMHPALCSTKYTTSLSTTIVLMNSLPAGHRSSWKRWSAVGTAHHRTQLWKASHSHRSLHTSCIHMGRSGNHVRWARMTRPSPSSLLFLSKLLQNDDPAIVWFNDNPGTDFHIHGFDASLESCMNIWLTFEQMTDVQNSLEDVQTVNSRELPNLFRSHCFKAGAALLYQPYLVSRSVLAFLSVWTGIYKSHSC